jgi:PIN domain nuclease of toxin-antitoxin system
VRLTRPVVEALEATENEKWLSPITTWEILLLVEKSRLKLASAFDLWFLDLRSKVPWKDALLNHEVVLETGRVRLSGPDPADRFLVATARVFDLTLVTADSHLIQSQECAILANR